LRLRVHGQSGTTSARFDDIIGLGAAVVVKRGKRLQRLRPDRFDDGSSSQNGQMPAPNFTSVSGGKSSLPNVGSSSLHRAISGKLSRLSAAAEIGSMAQVPRFE